MNRDQKVSLLLERRGIEDQRRLALDALDLTARQTSTWGSKQHRESRDREERRYEDALASYGQLSDDALDAALAERSNT